MHVCAEHMESKIRSAYTHIDRCQRVARSGSPHDYSIKLAPYSTGEHLKRIASLEWFSWQHDRVEIAAEALP